MGHHYASSAVGEGNLLQSVDQPRIATYSLLDQQQIVVKLLCGYLVIVFFCDGPNSAVAFRFPWNHVGQFFTASSAKRQLIKWTVIEVEIQCGGALGTK